VCEQALRGTGIEHTRRRVDDDDMALSDLVDEVSAAELGRGGVGSEDHVDCEGGGAEFAGGDGVDVREEAPMGDGEFDEGVGYFAGCIGGERVAGGGGHGVEEMKGRMLDAWDLGG